ncbi:unnamed protein product [Adineta ricciae]|uniref:EGF-like domain-containing protein n=1 Tax=Adineta ricciae TaxID=249248 RepID=A0A815M770_ADIRI|nr:unnamed protein product [Adineta ricciae]CAF1431280.1 unnamed protein product [Adineta ricciae]
MSNTIVWIVLLIIEHVSSSSVSFNQLKFCSNATWNLNATTFASNITVGSKPYAIFIDNNNTIYVANQQHNRIVIWPQGNSTLTTLSLANLSTPMSLFVTYSRYIYVDSDNLTGRIDKWTINSTVGIPVMYTCNKCYGIFIDDRNMMYCSMSTAHRIVTMSSNSTSLTTVAGTGASGSTVFTLSGPSGIFVDTSYNLYVADTNNHRIQFFRSGELNGTTLVGNKSLMATIPLKNPTGVTLDANGYLFIADKGNNRIVGSGPNGYRCIAGCNSSGPTPSRLSSPYSIGFDSFGNLFVVDNGNSRIQKFNLINSSCNYTEITSTTTLTTTKITSVQSNSINFIPSNVVSYNRLKFCSSASWNPNGITFSTNETTGTQNFGLFIDRNNTIYTVNRDTGDILIWSSNSTNVTRRISGNYTTARGLFVSIAGDIYIDNGYQNGQVEKYSLTDNISTPVMFVGQQCFGLFLDFNNTLYCSKNGFHQIVTKSLNTNSGSIKIVAGRDCAGSLPNQLNAPHGLFVNINFDLYVADYGNNRIQLFRPGELNGTTVAGNTSINTTISLYNPTGITFDAEDNIYIVDKSNQRIVVSGPTGFRCFLGCNGSGLLPYQMNAPQILSFDIYGNIYVTEWANNRIKQFFIVNNSCGKYLLKFTLRFLKKSFLLDEPTTQLSTVVTTVSYQKANVSSTVLILPSCLNQNQIGSNCNHSSAPCDILMPCQNSGTCINGNKTVNDYSCVCLSGFNGTQCEVDNRLCKPNTCQNNGKCTETSSTTFECSCRSGWTNTYCETKENYCENITCLNNGICRPLLLNFTCECLGTSYSGRYCENREQTTVVRQAVSRSFSYIAIIFISSVATFIIVMDVLKYVFGIDLTKGDYQELARKRRRWRRYRPWHSKEAKHPKQMQRLVYTNSLRVPSSGTLAMPNISIIEETIC